MMHVETTHSLGQKNFRFSLNFTTPEVGIQGPSGVGKTTLLRILAGLEPSARGTVTFQDETWLDSEKKILVPAWQRRVGWVPQDALCFPHLSVKENLLFSRRSTEEEARALATELEIENLFDRRVRNLSGGERHRVSLGRALLSKPRLLLLDEPFSSLDKPLREKLIAFVRAFSKNHAVPLIVVSHDLDPADREVFTLN